MHSYCKNATPVVNILESIQVPPISYLASLDIESLYTTICYINSRIRCVSVISEISGTGGSSATLLAPMWRVLPGELQQLLLELTRLMVREKKPLELDKLLPGQTPPQTPPFKTGQTPPFRKLYTTGVPPWTKQKRWRFTKRMATSDKGEIMD